MTRETAPNGREKVLVSLREAEGNQATIFGRCRGAMRDAQWTDEEIDAFAFEAFRFSYDHFMEVVATYCVVLPDEPGQTVVLDD